jgi:hypothetical protein
MSHQPANFPSYIRSSPAASQVQHGKDGSNRAPGRAQAHDSMIQHGGVGDGHHESCHSCIDPRQLTRCPASSYCFSAECGPPCKRRATRQEVGSTKKPGSSSRHHPKNDDALWENICSGTCEDVICTSPGSVDCSGDDHCEAQNACYDPDCEGAPCFERNCSSITCTEPSCPDNKCDSEPCWDENCGLDYPWHSCSVSHSAFHSDGFSYDENWASTETSEDSSHQGQRHQHVHEFRFGDSNNSHQMTQYGILQTNGTLTSPSIYNSIPTSSNSFKAENDQLFAAAGLADLHHTIPLSLEPHSSNQEMMAQYKPHSTYLGNRSHSHHHVRKYSNTLDKDMFNTNPNNSPTPTTTESSGNSLSRLSTHRSPAWPAHSPTSVYSHITKDMQPSPENFSTDEINESIETVSDSASLSITRQASFLDDVQAKPGEEFVCKWTEMDALNPVVCNHLCKDSLDLQVHIRDEHLTNKLEQYRCQWLGCSNNNDFKLRSKLERHMQTHTKREG